MFRLLLQELSKSVEGGGNASSGDVDHVGHGSTGAGRAAAGAGVGRGRISARLAAGSGGVGGSSVALEFATDDTVGLHLLEVGALELAISALQVETTVDLLEGAHVNTRIGVSREIRHSTVKGNSRVEFAAEVNGTGDGLQLGQQNGAQLVVAGDDETTVDLSQGGHADVGEASVAVEGQVSGSGQVGSGELSEVGRPETELTGELLQGRNGDGLDVADGQVLGGAQVGEFNLELLAVTGEVDEVGSVGQVVDVDGLQVRVVLNVEGANRLQRDTVQSAQAGVDDGDITNVGDTVGEAEVLETSESFPVDHTDGGELGEFQSGKDGGLDEPEVVADRLKGRGNDAGEVGGIVGSDAALDLLDTIQVKGTGEGFVDLDITVDSGAAGKAVGIALGLNSGVTACKKTMVSCVVFRPSVKPLFTYNRPP